MFRPLCLVTLALLALALFALVPSAASAPLPTNPPGPSRASVHCMLDYQDTFTPIGMPGYLVVAVRPGSEGGRLGTVTLAVGDVILSVGNYPATRDDHLDALVNLAFAEDNREIVVLSVETGEIVRHKF
jgi:hypothetical protein